MSFGEKSGMFDARLGEPDDGSEERDRGPRWGGGMMGIYPVDFLSIGRRFRLLVIYRG
jgi:hypothetical protein